jgi:hypothetical protein
MNIGPHALQLGQKSEIALSPSTKDGSYFGSDEGVLILSHHFLYEVLFFNCRAFSRSRSDSDGIL